MARNRRRNNECATLAAFGAGLLAWAVLPTKLVIVLLAVVLVFCGLSCGKR